MKKSLLLGGLLAATPLALLLPGCSGGSGGFGSILPTPKPVATATPAPASVARTSNLTLGNGQRAILQTTQTGAALTGTIQILAPLAQNRASTALTRAIKIGTFSITGVFTAPRGFNFIVKDGAATLFTMIGQFPTANEAGRYSITTFDGQTDSGVLPISGGPTATATPVPTGTAPPVGNIAVDLSFTPSSDSNFVQPGPLKGNFVFQSNRVAGFGIGSLNTNDSNALILAVVPNVTAGSVLDLANDPFRRGGTINQASASGFPKYFAPESGTITVTELTATKATFTFKDAVYAANPGGAARGTVKINGTVSGPSTN